MVVDNHLIINHTQLCNFPLAISSWKVYSSCTCTCKYECSPFPYTHVTTLYLPPVLLHAHTHTHTSHRSTDQLMVTKVFSYQRRFMGSCSLTDFSDSCPLPGDMSSQVMEHASIPRNHSLYNNLGMRESPGEGRRRGKGREGEGRKGGRETGERGRSQMKEEGMGAISCTCICGSLEWKSNIIPLCKSL